MSTPKREEVMGEWRKFHNEQLHNMQSSPNAIKVTEEDGMGAACEAGMGICQKHTSYRRISQ
jgi:hypothetical protein